MYKDMYSVEATEVLGNTSKYRLLKIRKEY